MSVQWKHVSDGCMCLSLCETAEPQEGQLRKVDLCASGQELAFVSDQKLKQCKIPSGFVIGQLLIQIEQVFFSLFTATNFIGQ